MKTNLLIATALFTGAVIADAQNRYFDSASSGTTWDGGTTSNWGTGTGGPYNTTTFGSYNIAQFEGTGATINSAGVGINGATFAANGYTIQGSTLTLGSPGGGPALTVNTGISATISAPVGKAGGATNLRKEGAGTLSLTGSTVSVDRMYVNAGTLDFSGGTMTVSTGDFIVSNTASSATYNQTSGTVNFSGGSFNVGNFGGAANTSTFSISGGTFNATSAALIPAVRNPANISVSGTGVLNVGGLTTGHSNVSSNLRPTVITISGGTFNVTGGNNILGNDTEASTTINQTGGVFNLTGGGYFYMGNSDTQTTQFNLSAGTFNVANTAEQYLAIRSTASLNVSGSADVTFKNLRIGHPSVGGTGTVNLDGGTLTLASMGRNNGTANFNFNGGILRPSAGNASFMTGLTRANVRNGGAIINDQGYSITIAQALLHSNLGGDAATDGGLSKQGTGDLTLTNASNSYTGGTSVFAGRLVASASGALGTAGVTVSSGAQVYAHSSATLANNFNIIGDGGTGSTLDTALRGAIRLDGATVSGTVTLTGDASLASTSGTGTFSGQITESGGPRVLSINKVGGGTVVLSNNANNYTGGTVVHNGTLRVSAATAAGTYNQMGSGPVTVNSGANLTLFTGSTSNNHTYNNNFTLNSATLQFEDGTTILPGTIALTGNNTFHGVWDGKDLQANGVISGAGGIVKTGSASLLMNNANIYSGDTTITGGEILLGVSPVGSVGAITSSATGTGTLRLNGGALYSNGVTARDVLNPVEVLQNSTLGNGTNNGTLTLKAPVLLGGAINTPRQLTVDSPVEIQGNVTSGSLIGLTKAGGSTLTLTSSGDWDGGTTISAGTLHVSGGGINNSGNISIASGATLRVNTTGQVRGPTLSIAAGGTVLLEAGTLRTNSISGSGSLVWNGGGLEIYSNAGLGTGSDVSSPNGSAVYLGRQMAATGNLTTGAGSTLELGDIYTAGATLFNQLSVTGSLTVGANTELRAITSPYLLRGSSGGSNVDYGTLVLVEALGGIVNAGNFDFVAPTTDGRPFSEFTGTWVSAGDPDQLDINTWYLETTPTQVLFHYKVSAAIPEPASAGIMIAGGLLLRVLSRRRAPHT